MEKYNTATQNILYELAKDGAISATAYALASYLNLAHRLNHLKHARRTLRQKVHKLNDQDKQRRANDLEGVEILTRAIHFVKM